MSTSLEGVEGGSKGILSSSKGSKEPVRIPSYDDLTPGIPDEIDARSVSQLALFLRNDLRGNAPSKDSSKTKKDPSTSSTPSSALYACLRGSPCEGLLAIARDFSPRVMVVSECEVLLDVSGLGRLIGEPPAIAAALTRAIVEASLARTARVAIAPTQTGARLLAARFPDSPIPRFPDIPIAFLRPLETLPPAMNHRDRARPYETFERWGIATLGDLAALPAADLASRLGRRGIALQRLARGLDPRPFVPDADTPRYMGRLELEWPLEALEPLSFVFARVLEPLSAALERADRGAVAIRLELRLTTRATYARVLQLPAPMRDPRVLRTLLLLDLESGPSPLRGFPPSPANAGFGGTGGGTSAVTVTAAVDAVSIELDPAPARITQFSLLERAVPSPETLSTLTARLSALVGESRIGSAVLLDTHQPDAFAMTEFRPGQMPDLAAFAERFGAPAVAFGGGGKVGPTEGSVLRRQRHPPAIRVSVERGRPAYIAAARRGMPQGAVTQAAGPWRTSGGWWTGSDACRTEGMGPGHRATADWNRDEWDVALTSGAVCRIFQNRTTERWFLDGVYD